MYNMQMWISKLGVISSALKKIRLFFLKMEEKVNEMFVHDLPWANEAAANICYLRNIHADA